MFPIDWLGSCLTNNVLTASEHAIKVFHTSLAFLFTGISMPFGRIPLFYRKIDFRMPEKIWFPAFWQ